jgi:hypothetical protein
VKYPNLRNRLDALEARSSLRTLTIKIEGGIPPEMLESKSEPPPGGDLQRQHATMVGRAPAEPVGSPVGRRWRARADQPASDIPPSKRSTGS